MLAITDMVTKGMALYNHLERELGPLDPDWLGGSPKEPYLIAFEGVSKNFYIDVFSDGTYKVYMYTLKPELIIREETLDYDEDIPTGCISFLKELLNETESR